MTIQTKISGKKGILFFLGFSMTFGEQLNSYIAGVSHLFVITGILISLFALVCWMFKGKLTLRFYTKEYKYYFVFLAYLTILFSLRLFSSLDYLDGHTVMDYYKQIIFMIIGLAVFSMIREEQEYTFALAEGFLFGFIIVLPVGTYGLYENTSRFLGTYINPNAYAIDCCFAFYCAMLLTRNGRQKTIKYLVAGLALTILLLTGTRGALFGIVLSLGLLIIQEKRGNTKFVAITVALIIFLSASIYFSDSGDLIFTRLLSSNRNAAAEFRFTIWENYLQNTDYFFWTGMKESQFGLIYKKSPHNTILGTFVRYGIVATLIFIIYCYCMVKKSIKLVFNKDIFFSSKIIGCMFLTSFIAGQTTEDMTLRSTYIIMAIAMAEFNRCECLHDMIRTNQKQVQ